ncbi:serine/threonine protein kinase [Thermodesulfobacteriota bacterium]
MVGLKFASGQKIEDYIIERKLGKGGMAELFLATDLILKRKVVIKFIGSHLENREVYKKQFLREAIIQAKLDNPHIVSIYRIFNYQNNLWLVMQYVKGTDLGRVIRKAESKRKRKRERAKMIYLLASWKRPILEKAEYQKLLRGQ